MSEYLNAQDLHQLTGYEKQLASCGWKFCTPEQSAEFDRHERELLALHESRKFEREQAKLQQSKALQNARNSSRRARERQRSVSWANHEKIKSIYLEAVRLSEATGIPHHVDHIYPLAGVSVSGLHVENNLRVIPAVDNMRKHNKMDSSI